MPILARFYGIIIKMFFLGKEHNPPHIHVAYGEFNAIVDIVTIEIIEGDLPKRAADMAIEWTKIHQNELLEIWDSQNFKQLAPLE